MTKKKDEERKRELIKLKEVYNTVHDKVIEGLVLIERKILGFEGRFENAKKTFDQALDMKVGAGLERLYKDVKWLSKLQSLSHRELKEKYSEIFKDITLEHTEYFRERTNNFVNYMTLKENEVKEMIQKLKEAIITKNSVQNQQKEKKRKKGACSHSKGERKYCLCETKIYPPSLE